MYVIYANLTISLVINIHFYLELYYKTTIEPIRDLC